MFIIIVILSDIYDKNFSKDSKIAIMLMVISTTTIYEVGVYKSILKQLNLLDDKGLKVHLDKITEFDFVDKSVVPSDSLLTEFVH